MQAASGKGSGTFSKRSTPRSQLLVGLHAFQCRLSLRERAFLAVGASLG